MKTDSRLFSVRMRLAASFFASLSLLPAGVALAQGEPPKTSLRSGVWALEFGAQPVFSSGFFSSAGLAIKHHVSDRTALRVGFFVNVSDEQAEGTVLEEGPNPPYRITGTTTDDYDDRRYSVYAHLQRAFSVTGRTAIHVYGGPTATWDSYENLDRLFYEDGGTRADRSEYESWNVGLEVGAGFEWFWTERVSLGAHYGMVGQYGEWDRVRTSDFVDPSAVQYRYEDVEHSKTFQVVTSGSYLRLAAYF